MKRRWTLPVIALSSFLLFVAADRQKPPILPGLLGETIEVSIVNVEVIVTDKQGNRVRGLTRDDFEILEDKKPQGITNFAEYSAEGAKVAGTAGVEAPQTVEAPPPQKRTVVVFLEKVWLPSFRREAIYGSMKTLLRNIVRPGDAVSIVTYSNHLEMRQEFTDDLGQIERVLDEVATEATGVRGDPYIEERRLETIRQRMIAQSSMGPRSSFDLPSASMQLIARKQYTEIAQKAAAINSILTGISGVEGRKVLILGTHRFGQVAGADVLYATGTAMLPPGFESEFGTGPLIEQIAKTANANGVTIYPIYAEGLGESVLGTAEDDSLNPSGADNRILTNELQPLQTIANRTGGTLAWGSKDIAQMLPRVQEDIESYYSLAYRTTTRREDRSRQIVVRAKNPQYVVRSRREFVEKSDTTKMKDRVVANLFRDADPSKLGISATIGEPRRKGSRWVTPLHVKIPIGALTALPQDGKHVGAFSVFIASGETLGRISDITQQTQPYTIPAADLEKAQASHFTYDFDLVTNDSVERVSVGVLDEVSKEYGLARLDFPRKTASN